MWQKLSKERQNEIDLVINNMLSQTDAEYPRDSLLDITKELGIEVYTTDFKEFSDKVRYIIDKEQSPTKIYLNKKHHSATMKTFTLAHALGYYMLHDGVRFRVVSYGYDALRLNNIV